MPKVARIAAHPLVVAVALGLLGPQTLDAAPRAKDEPMPREGGSPFDADADLEAAFRVGAALGLAPAPGVQLPEARSIDADEFARVEAEWHRITRLS